MSDDERKSGAGDADEKNAGLDELLSETRILLPGTEVFLGFLTTLPFTEHFADLDGPRRLVFIATFCATLLSFVLFVLPAAYHRIARPIRHKERFKNFSNRFLVAGLVPMSAGMVLASYLVAYEVFPSVARWIAATFAALIALLWWIVPLVRAHDREAKREGGREPKRQSVMQSAAPETARNVT